MLNYNEFEAIMKKDNCEKKFTYGVIVFDADSYEKVFGEKAKDVKERSFVVSSYCEAYDVAAGGYSIDGARMSELKIDGHMVHAKPNTKCYRLDNEMRFGDLMVEGAYIL